ncbi:adenine phosphoribosyltransferase [Kwoniella dejecticola CBS 10117]|uniref:adenine phosphoribosyltransferase n=1 Tax=Kwoniella dejecticola CBS 10117 TaxID=1296121 RepID=A0A1A6ADA0_9TREE|nr:adenine phosphoribosyltransferase [Kwoniella dejecticola CBS 10117]OBR88041.1 adenine phosphoribosyltransferase [Kwoniella dejecticola CBS 10117]
MSDVAYLKSLLGVHPDFPKKGITFLDIFPILRDPVAFETLITHLIHHIITANSEAGRPEVIVGLDARGFLLGPIIAMRLGCAFVPVRKGGKLPGAVEVVKYQKEYGTDEFEIQAGAIQDGQRCIVIDDLIATGGSAHAAGELIKKSGGKTLEYVFIVGLPFLKGHEKLDAKSYWMIEAED